MCGTIGARITGICTAGGACVSGGAWTGAILGGATVTGGAAGAGPCFGAVRARSSEATKGTHLPFLRWRYTVTGTWFGSTLKHIGCWDFSGCSTWEAGQFEQRS